MSSTVQMGIDVHSFQVEIPDEALDDLRRRIAATRWPSKELVGDRSQGVQLATLQELARYWTTDYDWRKAEAKLNDSALRRAGASCRIPQPGQRSTSHCCHYGRRAVSLLISASSASRPRRAGVGFLVVIAMWALSATIVRPRLPTAPGSGRKH